MNRSDPEPIHLAGSVLGAQVVSNLVANALQYGPGGAQFTECPEDAELVHRMNGSDPVERINAAPRTVLTVPDAIEENLQLMPRSV
jgi:hypothetical protein